MAVVLDHQGGHQLIFVFSLQTQTATLDSLASVPTSVTVILTAERSHTVLRDVAPFEPSGGIRPVCIGEPLYKVCATLLHTLHKPLIAGTLLSGNYGCGIKSGLEFAATSSTTLLTDSTRQLSG